VEKTQRLLGIVLAVLALEGCRGGAQQAQRPAASPAAKAAASTTSYASISATSKVPGALPIAATASGSRLASW
jgi:hypothetical protein